MSGPRSRSTEQLVCDAPLRSLPESWPTPGISRSITNWGMALSSLGPCRTIAHSLGLVSGPRMLADALGDGGSARIAAEVDRAPAGLAERAAVELQPARRARLGQPAARDDDVRLRAGTNQRLPVDRLRRAGREDLPAPPAAIE